MYTLWVNIKSSMADLHNLFNFVINPKAHVGQAHGNQAFHFRTEVSKQTKLAKSTFFNNNYIFFI